MSTKNYKAVISKFRDSIHVYKLRKQYTNKNKEDQKPSPLQRLTIFKDKLVENWNEITNVIKQTISTKKVTFKAPSEDIQKKVSFTNVLPDGNNDSSPLKNKLKGILKKSSSLLKSNSLNFNQKDSGPSHVYLKSLGKLAFRNTNTIVATISKNMNRNKHVKKIAKINLRDTINNAGLALYETGKPMEDKRMKKVMKEFNHSAEQIEAVANITTATKKTISKEKSLFNNHQKIPDKMNEEEITVDEIKENEDEENIDETTYEHQSIGINTSRIANLALSDTKSYFFKETQKYNEVPIKLPIDINEMPEFDKTLNILKKSMVATPNDSEVQKTLEINLMIARLNKEKNERILRQTRKQEKRLKDTLELAHKLQAQRQEKLNEERIQKLKTVEDRINKIKQLADNRKNSNKTSNYVISSLVKTRNQTELLTEQKRRQPEELRSAAILSEIKMNHQLYNPSQIQEHINLHDKYVRTLTAHYRIQREKSVGKLVKKTNDDIHSREASLKKEIDTLSKKIKIDYIKKREMFSEKVRLYNSQSKNIPKENLLLTNQKPEPAVVRPTILNIDELHQDDRQLILNVLRGSKKFMAGVKTAKVINKNELVYNNQDGSNTPRGMERVNRSTFHFSESKYEEANMKRSEASMKKVKERVQNDSIMEPNFEIARRLNFDNISTGKNTIMTINPFEINMNNQEQSEIVLKPWAKVK